MGQILVVIAPLFLIILGSAVMQKIMQLGEEWSRVLNDFALRIGFPVLIFSALVKTPFSFTQESGLIVANSLFILFSFALALLIGRVFHLSTEIRRSLSICFTFSNIAYLGIPVLVQISGPSVLTTASLIVAIYLFWIFTVGIGYLDYSIEKTKAAVAIFILKNLSRNPLLYAVALGILVGSLRITLPDVLTKSMDMVTASVTPTVLIVIGLFIGKSRIGRLKEWISILIFTVFTLMVLPGIFYCGVMLFGHDPARFSISIIQSAMPLAITPFALADRYHLDKTFIVRSIILSTILSVISLPFWIALLMK
ncbi:MAG: AEC family transporter [Candidatus Delongbacteria bacterium]|nr:AEC family transporter [Candidatus Delongbacteria bacterium]